MSVITDPLSPSFADFGGRDSLSKVSALDLVAESSGNADDHNISVIDEEEKESEPLSVEQMRTPSTCLSPLSQSMVDLKFECAQNGKIASSHPTADQLQQHHLPALPVSGLDKVETRSCPDLDTEYNNISEPDADHGTPPLHGNGSSAERERSKSRPLLLSNTDITPRSSVQSDDADKHGTIDRGDVLKLVGGDEDGDGVDGVNGHKSNDDEHGKEPKIEVLQNGRNGINEQSDDSEDALKSVIHQLPNGAVDDNTIAMKQLKLQNVETEQPHHTEDHVQNGNIKTKIDGPTGYSLIAMMKGQTMEHVVSHTTKHHQHHNR